MSVTAVAHPNIALIKYWGKQALPGNVPATPSVSITLDALTSTTTVRASDTDQIVLNGEIAEDALFDADYQPIPDSDPQQVMARFTGFTDRVLPAIQEPVLASDPHIVFCAAIDRNGYLPTHNLKFAQPQGKDPVWNNANCRNRRIFDDRVGLAAGRNEAPFLLQAYRRDMGGGQFVLMKDVSAPIVVRGRHWGGLRLAYKPD